MINTWTKYRTYLLFSRPTGVRVATMGATTLLLLALVGAISANSDNINPFLELRSNFEFLSGETNLDEPAYRLRDVVQPTYVYVDLDVYLAESRFNGIVTHVVDVLESGLTQIVLHQRVVAITAVTIYDSANNIVPLTPLDSYETDSYYEILKINLANAIDAGTYTIIITYLGQINENPIDRGFYKGYYYYNDEKRYYATTQFQPHHARKAFPCFDEPQFKSRYVISIVRDASLSESYSNMAINETKIESENRIRETFLPTPIISAYLVAFHVSDFVSTNSTGTEAKPFGIISREGVTSQHAYAAQIGLRITEELDEYLQFGYYTMGQGQPMKNDHIALPDFPSGAMENWGMVNYREAYLLYDEQNTNLNNKIFIATILSHELAHKWFGNLVTCFWWSNLWLNESFASFFEYFATHMADPSLELDDQFVVDYVHSALNWDASAGATPMNWTAVSDNPSINSHFSTTSYAKGASVLRMMEHFVGPRIFRNALRYYIRDKQYKLGTPEDMYNAFRTAVAEDPTFVVQYPGIDVGEVFDSWVQNPGSPVLNVDVNMDSGTINITQQRFLLNGETRDTLWQVPVSWTHSGNLNFVNTKPDFVLTQRTSTVEKGAGHHYVILNVAQSGLYRVNYDDHNWEMIAAALRDNRESIHKLNRAQIVNDVLHFIRADAISMSRAFDVLSFLESETDYYVWAGALGQLDIIRRRLEHLPEVQEEFHDYLLELMDAVIDHLGYEENDSDSTSTKLARMIIMNYACNTLGHQGCVDYSVARWAQYKANESNLVKPNERRYVYCVGLREGDSTDYTFLFNKYNTSENTADMVVILRALACTKDQTQIQHYLEQSLYNDKIRVHDKTNAISFALQGNKENLETVLNFIKDRYSDISEWYGGVARLNIALNALTTYLTDFETIVEFQGWLYENQVELGSSFTTGDNIVNAAIENIKWGNSVAVEMFSILRSRNSAAAVVSPFALLLVALTAHLLH